MSTSEPLSAEELTAIERVCADPADGAALELRHIMIRLLATVRAEQRRADEAEAGRDHLKRREADIIAATEPADGGQWRADIVSAINRLRRERDEARAEAERLRGCAVSYFATAGAAMLGGPSGCPLEVPQWGAAVAKASSEATAMNLSMVVSLVARVSPRREGSTGRGGR